MGEPVPLKANFLSELKKSQVCGGVNKLKEKQAQAREEQEKEDFKNFMEQFTTENFLLKMPEVDNQGNKIPLWKRELLAKKNAEKAKQDGLLERARLEEERRLSSIPAWKKQLMQRK